MSALLCIGSFAAGFVLVVLLVVLYRMAYRLETWHKRERVYTSIYPSTPDDTTPSGSHEESRRA